MTWPACSGSCASLWLPAFNHLPSAAHSRSSSSATVVTDMAVAIIAPPPPSHQHQQRPPPAVSPVLIPHTGAKLPAPTVPSSPQCCSCWHLTKCGHSFATPARSPRRDSMLACSPQQPPLQQLLPADNTAVDADIQTHGVFDMEADCADTRPVPAELDPASLGYASKGKPQPWAVRPMDLYDSLRAQIRAIDDDDNEFYSS